MAALEIEPPLRKYCHTGEPKEGSAKSEKGIPGLCGVNISYE